MSGPPLLAVPNVSEGRDRVAIAAIGAALAAAPVRLLDTHADPDHHRSVFTLAGSPGRLAPALLAGAREVLARVDLNAPRGHHPHVGALDVAPVVYLEAQARGAACAEALVAADMLGAELGLPVFLYGALAGGRTRAQIRRGGLPVLGHRMASGELAPDFGPAEPHPTGGVALVAARPPLVAFNLELGPPARLEDARRIAALIREGGPRGLPGLRAIGVPLATRGGTPQVSMNVEDPLALPLAEVVAAVREHAPVTAAEVVGMVPRASLADFPADVPIGGFAASRQVLEEALGL